MWRSQIPRTRSVGLFVLLSVGLLAVGAAGCEKRRRPDKLYEVADREAPGPGSLPVPRAMAPAPRRSAVRPDPMRPARTLDFAYRDRRLLAKGQHRGGRVWVPRHRRHSRPRFPMVVVLHGIEKPQHRGPHTLMSGEADLRPVVARLTRQRRIRPVLLAAPSQTRDAKTARTLWTPGGFDLLSFVRAVEARLSSLGVAVDRGQLSVVAHSGAGCYLAGNTGHGAFGVARQLDRLRRHGIRVHWLGLMDTCLFGAHGARWLRSAMGSASTRVAAMWTGPPEWGRRAYRRPRAFAYAMGATRPLPCARARYASCRGAPDGSWVLAARRRALRGGSLSPHFALPAWFLEELLLRWLPGSREA